MSGQPLPEWEALLASAAHLQKIIPDAVLVGGTAVASYAHHWISVDHDHTLGDLRTRFDGILADLESVAGWKTARVKRPVLILGSLDGIETGVRQLIRETPLETTHIDVDGVSLTLPTREEMLRIKAVLVLKRNATRDYLDLVALADLLGEAGAVKALEPFDALYPQPNGASATQQLQIQLANPLPFDLDDTNLADYRHLDPKWQDWDAVKAACSSMSLALLTT